MAASLSELEALWRRAGLEAAAATLRATAADYREMAAQVKMPCRTHFSYTSAHIKKIDYESKAQLLEGQAKHIEEL